MYGTKFKTVENYTFPVSEKLHRVEDGGDETREEVALTINCLRNKYAFPPLCGVRFKKEECQSGSSYVCKQQQHWFFFAVFCVCSGKNNLFTLINFIRSA